MQIFPKNRAPLFSICSFVMKGVDISCASQASLAIFSSMEQYPSSPSSQLSPSSSSSSCPQQAGGRAIDRHNPIITDAKRVTRTPGSTPFEYKSPVSPNLNDHKDQEYEKKKKKSRKLFDFGRKINGDKEGKNDHDYQVNKNVREPSDKISMKGCAAYKPGDYIRRPESFRYLSDDTPSLHVLSDFDPVSKQMVSYESKKGDAEEKEIEGSAGTEDGSKASKPGSSSSSTSCGSSDNQVVDLMVSLHCKGCEGKVRKHISRMEGVTSFDIDFAAKKVTVVGNVTPLGVLATISKVKNARLWTPPVPSSTIDHVALNEGTCTKSREYGED